MRAMLFSLAVAVTANLGVAGFAAAQNTPDQGPWYEAITVNGFFEASYSHNLDRPESEGNALRVFDYDDREVKLDLAELVVQKPVAGPGELGFRFDATVGQSVPAVTAAAGLFRDTETGDAHDYDLQQAFVSWIAPLGQGLRIDAGKFVTPFGMELIEGYDGYNDNQTRSLLFGYAIPFTHTGLRVSYPFTGKLTVAAMVVQGWDNWQDNNGAKSLVVQLALAPSPRWALYVNAMGGPEQRDDTQDRRNLYNVVATFKPDGRLAFGLDGVIGDEGGLLASGARARWSALAGYVRWTLADTFALALRAEVFDDPDGVRTGTAQRLHEVTLTPEWKLGEHVVLRGDLRRDRSDADVFQDHARPASDQTTVSAAVLLLY